MRLLKLLDDTPVVPGDVRPAYEGGAQARQILNDAEDDLRDWTLDVEDDAAAAHTQQHKTSHRGSVEYASRDSGYTQGQERTSYDDDKDTEYVPDSTVGTTTAGQVSGGTGSGAPVSDEELRGEQLPLSSETLSPPPRIEDGGEKELSKDVKGLFAEF